MEAYFDYVSKFSEKPKIIINSKSNPFQYQYLKLMGIEDDQMIEWNYTKIRVERLIFPCFRPTQIPILFDKNYYIYSKRGFDFLRARLLTESSEQGKTLKLLISREDASNRKIINEDELMKNLEPAGFQKVTLGSLTIAQQINLFSQAKKVIFPHGAAQVNMIFSDNANIVDYFLLSERPIILITFMKSATCLSTLIDYHTLKR